MDKEVTKVDSLLARLSSEAGLLSGRLRSLPFLREDRGGADEGCVLVGDESACVTLGAPLRGRRAGRRWVPAEGEREQPRLLFSRDNAFTAGEYVAVQRSSGEWQWGVIEDDAAGEACAWPPVPEAQTAGSKSSGLLDDLADLFSLGGGSQGDAYRVVVESTDGGSEFKYRIIYAVRSGRTPQQEPIRPAPRQRHTAISPLPAARVRD